MADTPPICPYCGNTAVLRDSAAVYGGRSYGMIWDCRPCDAYVGVHKNSPTHKPLGRLANRELRAAKIRAHRALDPLWRDTSATIRRGDVYRWLARHMGIDRRDCHIGMFSVEQCLEVEAICRSPFCLSDLPIKQEKQHGGAKDS